MNDLQLFSALNASAATAHWQIAMALAIAQWLIWTVPAGLFIAWLRADDAIRKDLLELLAAVMLALALAQVVTHLWPRPRPFMLHLGLQYLPHSPDPGLPSDHVTVFWSLACAALAIPRFRPWTLPLLGLGLVVGWSRVFLGVHFPLDVIGALPVAIGGAALARCLRPWMQAPYAAAVRCWHLAATYIERP